MTKKYKESLGAWARMVLKAELISRETKVLSALCKTIKPLEEGNLSTVPFQHTL